MNDHACSKSPISGTALAVRGQLFLARARVARGPARKEAARMAEEAFEAAFKQNPLLLRDYAEARAEAARMR